MTSPILKTKLFIPPPREGFISRPRLTTLINEHVKQKVSFISAPAGFGKSTLLSEWAVQSEIPVCWISLDTAENDPVKFLSYLIASVQTIWKDLGDATLSALQSPGSPSVEYLLNTWLNEIVEHATDFALILDDFHHIQNPIILDMICNLPDRQPSQMHLILASRADLPISCSRLRAQGDLNEIGIENLRFTLEESIAFLDYQLGQSISDDDAHLLSERTEGWIVGLHMAVLSMRSSEDVSQYIAQFSAQNRYITDYLLDEVLLHQSEEVKGFLLATSILEKFNAPLCDQVVGIDNSQEVIDTLERSGLFTIPLDSTRNWHRYHHLFAELLRIRLEQSPSLDSEVLHRRASEWFANENMLDESIAHAFTVEDYPLAIKRIEKSLNLIVSQGMFRNYLSWVDKIPKEFLQEKPRLEIIKVFMLHEMGKLSERDKQLKYVNNLLSPTPKNIKGLNKGEIINHGILASIKAIIYASSDFLIDETYQFSELADKLLPHKYMYWRTLALGTIPFLHRAMGNYNKSNSVYQNLLEKALDEGFTFQAFLTYSVMTKVYLETNRLKLAIVTCQKAIDLDKRQSIKLSFAKYTYLLMGELLYQSGQIDAAEAYVEKGLEHVVRHGEIYSIIDGYATLIKIQIANGDYEQAQAILKEVKLVIGELSTSKNATKIVDAWEAYIQIMLGEDSKATPWAEEDGFDRLDGNYLFDLGSHSYVGIYRVSQTPIQIYSDFIKLTTAKLYIHQNKLESASDLIEGVLDRMSQGGSTIYQIDFMVAKANLLIKFKQKPEALLVLQESIQIAAGEGFIQTFLNEGEEIRELLENLKDQPDGELEEQVFILQILERIHMKTQNSYGDKEGQLVNLTSREIEVLKMLSTGTSYANAAEALSISRNTIKTHTKSIYQKLGVNGLLQALNQAKKLKLII